MEKLNKFEEFIKKGKLKKAGFSTEMILKELEVGKKDLLSAKDSFKKNDNKWATIQAYYSIYHAVRALLFKSGYREESHTALKVAFRELYINSKILDIKVYNALERGMDLRELADYKETFSKEGAEILLQNVEDAILIIEDLLLNK